MRPRISITGFVRPSVRPWVTLLSKTREINIFEQVDTQGGILGALDTSFHLYKMVYLSVCPSVHQSVRHDSANINKNQ